MAGNGKQPTEGRTGQQFFGCIHRLMPVPAVYAFINFCSRSGHDCYKIAVCFEQLKKAGGREQRNIFPSACAEYY
jgi:hypothetical protein